MPGFEPVLALAFVRSDINPAFNAVQTLVAAKRDSNWRIEMYHSTPTAFHGRPDLAEALTAELRSVLRES